MTDKNDVVIAIAASLYAARMTEDAIRSEPDMDVIAAEAWNIYYALERAVRTSPKRYGDVGMHPSGRVEPPGEPGAPPRG